MSQENAGLRYLFYGGVILGILYYVFIYSKQIDLVPAGSVPNNSGGVSAILVPPVVPPAEIVPAISDLNGSFYADDYLSIKLNKAEVYSDNGPWDKQRTITIPSVKTGDFIDFIVKNGGGAGGFIGTWKWNGKTYNTSASMFPGKVVPAFNWSGMGSIFPNAQWVWSADDCNICTNTFSWRVA